MISKGEKQIGYIYNVADKEYRRKIEGVSEIKFDAFGLPLKDYKIYGNTEQEIIAEENVDVAGASPLTIKGVGLPLKNYEIFGNTTQETTTGKNILVGTYIEKEVKGNAPIILLVSPNTTYTLTISQTLKVEGTGTNPKRAQHWKTSYDSEGNVLNSTSICVMNFTSIDETIVKTATFTTPSNCTSLKIDLGAYISNPPTLLTNYYQLEQGSTATPYEPYTGSQPSPNPDYPQEIESVGDIVLPKEYQQVEYIESTGTQYIDTGVYPYKTTTELSFAYTDLESPQYKRFLALYDNTKTSIERYYSIIADNGNFKFGNRNGNLFKISQQDTNKHKIIFNDKNNSVYFDDAYISQRSDLDLTSKSGVTLTIFGTMSKSGVGDNTKMSGKLYSCKLTDKETNKLIRDFIPCYRKSDNEIGLYDIVNNIFYTNSGTGTFLKGNDANQYKIPVNVASENLLDFNNFEIKTRLGYFEGCWYNLKPNTTYTISTNISCSSTSLTPTLNNPTQNATIVCSTDTSITSPSSNNEGVYTTKNITKTLTTDYSGKLFIGVRNGYLSIIKQLDGYWVQINEGSTAKPYQPYYNTTTNIYLNAPLRKIGDYADYVDFSEGKVVRNIAELILNGSEIWLMNHGIGMFHTNSNLIKIKDINSREGVSSHFKYNSVNSGIYDALKNGEFAIQLYNNTSAYLFFKKMSFTTTNEFKTWLSTHNTMINYILKTPTEETITLPSILTTNGTNNITIDTKTPPSNIYLKSCVTPTSPSPNFPKNIESTGDLITDEEDEHYGKYKIPVNIQDGDYNETTNIYLDAPLRKEKTTNAYDYIDYKNKKCIRNIKRIILKGTESWAYNEDENIYYISNWADNNNAKKPLSNSEKSKSSSDYFINMSKDEIVNAESGFGINEDGDLFVKFYDYNYEITDFVTWLSEHNVAIDYILNNTEETSVTLPEIQTKKGTNNLSIDTNTKSSKVYIENKEKYLDKIIKKEKKIIQVEDIKTKEGEGGVQITSVEQPLKNYEIFGNTTQETTTGKNIFYFDDNTTFSKNNNATFLSKDVNNQSFKFIAKSNNTHSGVYIRDMLETNNTIYSTQVILKTNYTGSINVRFGSQDALYKTISVIEGQEYLIKFENITNTISALAFYISRPSVDIEAEIRQVMIEKSTSCSTYEPYTGAQPSPSPDYPQEIESVGDLVTDTTDENYGKYKIPVNVKSENACFNILSKETKTKYATTLTIEYIEGKLKPDTYYTIIGKCTPNSKFYIDKTNDTISSGWVNVNVGDDGILFYNIRTPSDLSSLMPSSFGGKLALQILKVNRDGNDELPNYSDLMIVEGKYTRETIPPYQPYYNTTTNIYLSAPLRKIGDYADYVDFKEGKVVRNIGEVIFEGSESLWNLQSINSYNIANFRITIDKTLKSYCNSFTKQNSLISVTKTEGYMIAEYRTLYIRINANRCSTINEFKNWLSQNHIIFDYSLETPTEETITLPSILTTNGTNNISIDTKIKGKFSAEYTESINDQTIFVNKTIHKNGFEHVAKGELPLTIRGYGNNFKNYEIFGNTTQETTTGKNLFDYITTFNKSLAGLTNTLNENGNITISGKPASSYVRVVGAYNITDMLEDGKTYTLVSTFNTTLIVFQLTLVKADGSGNDYIGAYTSARKFVVDKTKYSSYSIMLQTSSLSTWGDEERTFTGTAMLYKGEGNDTFEKYTGGIASPSPDYPQEIESVGDLVTDTTDENYGKYKIPVNVKSENLANTSSNNITNKMIGTTDGQIVNVSKYVSTINYIEAKPNTNYCLSFNRYENVTYQEVEQPCMFEYDENYNYLGFQLLNNSKSLTITTKSNTKYLRFRIKNDSNVITDVYNIMLNEGSTAKPYQPYYNTTTNIYLNAPLRKIGDYADYVDFKEGKVVRNIWEKTFNTLTQTTGNPTLKDNYAVYGIYNIFEANKKCKATSVSQLSCFCNNFKHSKDVWLGRAEGVACYQRNIILDIRNEYGDTKAKFSEWLSQNPITIDYILETPTEETIELPSILTTTGTNNISIDTKTPPSSAYFKTRDNMPQTTQIDEEQVSAQSEDL